MGSVPKASNTGRVATPPFRGIGSPRGILPFLNCTLPMEGAGETTPVKVTPWPNTDGFTEALNVTAAGACDTVRATAAEFTAGEFPFPGKVAVRKWLPAEKLATVSRATPEALETGVP